MSRPDRPADEFRQRPRLTAQLSGLQKVGCQQATGHVDQLSKPVGSLRARFERMQFASCPTPTFDVGLQCRPGPLYHKRHVNYYPTGYSNAPREQSKYITTVLRPFFRDHLGEPVPEENFWILWRKGRLMEADTLTIRLGATPSGLTSAYASIISPYFLQAGCPSCRPTNSIKALKAQSSQTIVSRFS